MFTLVVKLLIIQMTVQLTLTTYLEGRTAQHVRLLETPSTNATAKRLTCPVYSIRPEGQFAKYYKYAVKEDQFSKDANWTLKEDALTFKQCAILAASEMYKMFLFDKNGCKVSNYLYTRRLPEPCGNETAALVYMTKPQKIHCPAEYFILGDGDKYFGSLCGIGTDMEVNCAKTVLVAYSIAQKLEIALVEGECFVASPVGSFTSHDQQKEACESHGYQTCKPTDLESRDKFLQHVNAVAASLPSVFRVDLSYNETSSTWLWGETGIEQPTDDAEEWDVLSSNFTEKPEGVMFPLGLQNKESIPSLTHACCVPN